MSILIKGLKMPKDTKALKDNVMTINVWADGHVYVLGKNPMYLHDAATELPEHGDLIDRDEQIERAWRLELNTRELIAEMLNTATVVIPAERSEAGPCDDCDERSDVGCSWCRRMERSEDEAD